MDTRSTNCQSSQMKTNKMNQKKEARKLPNTVQRSLFKVDHVHMKSDGPSHGEVDFLNPNPAEIFIGDTPLADYLEDVGIAWVKGLRGLLHKSDLSTLTMSYERRGRKAIDPRIIIGLIVYGILQRQWSLRELEKLAKRDVAAWWICGGLHPDHSTIGKFINMHAEALTEDYFTELMKTLFRNLNLSNGEAACDGTVIEAAASNFKTLKEEAAREAAQEARKIAFSRPDDRRVQKKAERLPLHYFLL